MESRGFLDFNSEGKLMIKNFVNTGKKVVLAAVCSIALAACATDPAKMVPTVSKSEVGFDAGVTVQVSGSKESLVKNASIQSAVEAALAQSELFSPTSEKGYTLRLDVLAIENPLIGIDLASKVRVGWLLRKQGNPEAIWSEQISSEAKVGFAESPIAAQRMAKANERAVAANIEQGLSALSEFAQQTITTKAE